MTAQSIHRFELPGSDLDIDKMPGHWLLARLGKRVLRPGGLGMTEALLAKLSIAPADEVVELAPGLGATARRIIAAKPRRYIGVERDSMAAAWTKRQLPKSASISVVTGIADRTGLPDSSASVVIGEAMLTMNTDEHKRRIIQEAFRLLRPGGRYGIHELCLTDATTPADQQKIDRDLSATIHVGARPLPTGEWKKLLERAGFHAVAIGHAPMHLLHPRRLIADEGVIGALRIAKNLLLNAKARKRVLAMRQVFERYQKNLNAIYIIAEKPQKGA